jgi:LysM repeat protein
LLLSGNFGFSWHDIENTSKGNMTDEQSNPDFHTVESAETLDSIARKYGLTAKHLLARNQLKPGALIYPGQKLKLRPGLGEASITAPISILPPVAPAYPEGHRVCLVHGFHRIKANETITRIAALFGVSTQALLEVNRLEWNSPIFIGQKLVIPGVHETQNCPDVRPLPVKYRNLARKIVKIGLAASATDEQIAAALSQIQRLSPASENAADETIARLLSSRADEQMQVSAWVWLEQLKVELSNA